MELSGPFRYHLRLAAIRMNAVNAPDGGTELSGPAAQRVPRLYVISHYQAPNYMGVTNQLASQALQYPGKHLHEHRAPRNYPQLG